MIKPIKTDSELIDELNKAEDKLVVLHFYANWCKACIVIESTVESLSEEYKQVIFLKTDVDVNLESSTKYDISSMPTFIFLKDRKILERLHGASRSKLEENIKKLM